MATKGGRGRESTGVRRRAYRVTHFKFLNEYEPPYGGKTFVGTLDRACKRLVKMYGTCAEVRCWRLASTPSMAAGPSCGWSGDGG